MNDNINTMLTTIGMGRPWKIMQMGQYLFFITLYLQWRRQDLVRNNLRVTHKNIMKFMQ